MSKIYLYRVLYKGKVIDEIEVAVQEPEGVEKAEIDDTAYAQALNSLEVIFAPSNDEDK